MRKEFKLYLKNNSLPEKYFGYCEKIEEVFGGMDIDNIILSYKYISNVRNKLHTITASSGSISNYITALNHYLNFAFSATKLTATTCATSHSLSRYHVSRAEDVPLTTDVAFICETLEQEYDGVVRFAEKLLPQAEFKYIPIIISNQEPMHDSPDGGEKILGAFFASEKPHIEIYYRNADPHDAAAFRKCLAHEYMHYMHYVYADKEYDNAKKELKEALSDFFGVLYSIHRRQKDDLRVAKARYNSWKRNFGTYWPYANALYFYQVHGKEMKFSSDYKQYEDYGCIGKFIQVFGSTLHPDDAYKTMKEI